MDPKIARGNFYRLPEDVLTMILKRHDDAKLLLCISLASKQFASIVSDIDSLTLTFELAPDNFPPDQFDQIIAGLWKRFRKLQHLRIILRVPFFQTYEPFERCQVSVGPEFELGYLLLTRPHHPTLTDASPVSIWSRAFEDARNESLPDLVRRELKNARNEVILGILQAHLGITHYFSMIAWRLASNNSKFKSIAISDQSKRWMVCMGEEEIARSFNKPMAYPEKLDFLEVNMWEAPLITVPALGCFLRDVKFFEVKPGGKPPRSQPDVLQQFVWNNSDTDWTIFREVSKEIMFSNDLNKQKTSIIMPTEILFGLFNPLLKDLYKEVPRCRYVNDAEIEYDESYY